MQVDYSKKLIDDEVFDGATPQLPVLGSAQWQLLLECPCFTHCSRLPRLSRPASASAGGNLCAARDLPAAPVWVPSTLRLADLHALNAACQELTLPVEAASCNVWTLQGLWRRYHLL